MLREFLDSSASGGLVLMGAAALALIVANSPLSTTYFAALSSYLGPLSVLHWINPALVEPVNVSLRTFSFSQNSLPIAEESVDVITLKRPEGSPASSARDASARADKGVSATGFRTIAHPAAIAEP